MLKYFSMTIFIIVFIVISEIQSQLATRISYISFTSFIDHDYDNSIRRNEVQYSQLQESDDSPFTAIELPFSFILSGIAVDYLFASPNGALYYSPVQPCPDNFFCSLADNHYNIIAAFLTDLNPGTSINGKISSYANDDMSIFTIKYENIVYYDTSLENSFSVSIYNDSRIVLAYHKITTDSNYPDNAGGGFISGLRAPEIDSYTYYDESQISFELSEWGYGMVGVYPLREDISTGKKFNICPVSRSWCMHPNYLEISTNSTSIDAPIVLSSLLIACNDQLDFALLLSSSSNYNETNADLYMALACDNAIIDNNLQIHCNSSLITGMKNLTEGWLHAWPLWRPRYGNFSTSSDLFIEIEQKSDGLDNQYSLIQVEGLGLEILGTNSSNSTDNSDCSSSTAVYNFTETCSPCSICSYDFTCVGSNCIFPSMLEVDRYRTEDCNNECISTSVGNQYYIGTDDVCCKYSEMDCSGKCYGDSSTSFFDGQRYCCPADQVVDCSGVCGGTTIYDNCGVCGGDDFTGESCFDSLDIILSTGVSNDTYFPVFDLSSPEMSLSIVYKFNVSNFSNHTVELNLNDLSTDGEEVSRLGPSISLNESSAILKSGANRSFEFAVSLREIYTGDRKGWESKVIRVEYFLPGANSRFRNFLVVNPSSRECSTVSDIDTCRRLPGCLLCNKYPNIRVLRERKVTLNEKKTWKENLQDGWDTLLGLGFLSNHRKLISEVTKANSVLHAKRALFTEFFPFYTEDDGDELIDGDCFDGWFLEDCPLNFVDNSGFEVKNHIILPMLLILATTLLIV